VTPLSFEPKICSISYNPSALTATLWMTIAGTFETYAKSMTKSL